MLIIYICKRVPDFCAFIANVDITAAINTHSLISLAFYSLVEKEKVILFLLNRAENSFLSKVTHAFLTRWWRVHINVGPETALPSELLLRKIHQHLSILTNQHVGSFQRGAAQRCSVTRSPRRRVYQLEARRRLQNAESTFLCKFDDSLTNELTTDENMVWGNV